MAGNDAFANFLAPGLAQYGRSKAADIPKSPQTPAMPEEVDTSGQRDYMKQRLKAKKGRQSTILSGLGVSEKDKKPVLG